MATPIILSVLRAFQVLSVFGGRQSVLTTTEIAATLDMNRKTVHRFLLSLEKVGAVSRVGRGQYMLGLALADLGNQVAIHKVLAEAAMPCILSLAGTMNESLQVGVLEHNEIVSIAHVPSRHSLSIGIRVGMKWPAYCTAIGKNLLADLPDDDLRAYLEHVELEPRTEHSITDPVAMAEHLQIVRKQGYAINDQESELGMRGIAVPVLNRHGGYIAALSISGPTTRLPLDNITTIKSELQLCAERISLALYGGDADD